jgi:cytoskeleton protein RodZ
MTKMTHLTLEEGGGLNRRRIHLREISGEADSPLETVGQDLRAARQRRGDDLATVSRYLKIRKDHLEALEEDRFEALPGRTYAVGFIRAYSDYLGLDAVQSVERFKREIAGRAGGAEPTAAGTFTPEVEERRLPHGWVVIAAVVVLVVAYGAYRLAMSADKMLSPTVAPVPVSLAPKVPAPKPVAVTPAPQPAAPPPQTTQQATTSTSTAPTATPDNAATAQAALPPAQPQTLAQIIAALPPGNAYGAQNAGGRVILHVRAPTRVLVQANDGTVYINRVLKPGDTYRVPDRVGITLTTSDGAAVAIELDSQIMGTAGKTSQVTEGLSLDPQAISDRANGNPG